MIKSSHTAKSMTMPGKSTALDREPLTVLIRHWKAGDRDARQRVADLLYQHLHQQASNILRSRNPEATLSPTALVNETFINLDIYQFEVPNRFAFRALAGTVMRNVLAANARAKLALKRAHDPMTVTLSSVAGPVEPLTAEAFFDLHTLLETLQQAHPRSYRVCEGHYFAGLDYQELAQMEGVSEATVARDLRFVRAWLKARIELVGNDQNLK